MCYSIEEDMQEEWHPQVASQEGKQLERYIHIIYIVYLFVFSLPHSPHSDIDMSSYFFFFFFLFLFSLFYQSHPSHFCCIFVVLMQYNPSFANIQFRKRECNFT